MNYGILAGGLVTVSLLLLAVESGHRKKALRIGSGFVACYGAGVLCWLALGVLMDQSPLVVISSLQLLFLALSAKAGGSNHG